MAFETHVTIVYKQPDNQVTLLSLPALSTHAKTYIYIYIINQKGEHNEFSVYQYRILNRISGKVNSAKEFLLLIHPLTSVLTDSYWFLSVHIDLIFSLGHISSHQFSSVPHIS